MKDIDCLIIGPNDYNFEEQVNLIGAFDKQSGAYKDLNLAFISHLNRPYRVLDILNELRISASGPERKLLHNYDILWPVILYLGSYLNNNGLSFDYINLFHLQKEELRQKLHLNNVRTIAITTTLYVSVNPILEIIQYIRKINTDVKIIVGGPYIANQPQISDMQSVKDLLNYIDADFYIFSKSAGEKILVDILRRLKANDALESIDNIAYRKDSAIVINSLYETSLSLEDNMIDYSLFSSDSIGEFVNVRTSRSCPFSCGYCGFPNRSGKYQFLDIEKIEQELDAIEKIGAVTTVTFIDDTLNINKDRFKKLLKQMIKKNYSFKWNCYYRCDIGDTETIELMKKAGCEGVFLGVESGNDEVLKKMNKKARKKDYLKYIPIIRENGILTATSLIIGYPGETEDTIQETFDLIETVTPDFFRAQLWYLDPVTPVWEKRKEYGIQGSAFNWSHFTMDSDTAAQWVDTCFKTIKNSIWLQQYGFEMWSVFYLQRKGMSVEQVKDLLGCFNRIVADQLDDPFQTDVPQYLFSKLKRTCNVI